MKIKIIGSQPIEVGQIKEAMEAILLKLSASRKEKEEVVIKSYDMYVRLQVYDEETDELKNVVLGQSYETNYNVNFGKRGMHINSKQGNYIGESDCSEDDY